MLAASLEAPLYVMDMKSELDHRAPVVLIAKALKASAPLVCASEDVVTTYVPAPYPALLSRVVVQPVSGCGG